MRILLIQSYAPVLAPIFPLGLASLKAALSPDHQVEIFDPNIEEGGLESLWRFITDFQPEVIGLSLRNIDTGQSTEPISFINGFSSTLQVTKSCAPNAFIIAGGTGFSIFGKELMERFQELDAGVFLEGETTVREILSHRDQLDKVKGIFLRSSGDVIFTGKNPFVDPNGLPIPDRGYRLSTYTKKCGEYADSLYAVGVQSKRGCLYRCAHCVYPYLEGSALRLRSPSKVVDEIEYLTTQKIDKLFIVDSVFNQPYDHALSICEEIIRRKLDVAWSAYFRDDLLDDRLMKKAEEAGCTLFELSPDGLTDRAMKVLNKDFSLEQVFRTARLLAESERSSVVYNFLRNLPDEDLQEKVRGRETIKRIVEICGEKMDGYHPNLSRIR
ncbi:MAG: cobalamin-dependent protein, partial [Proteobacteria bacterium]|nr:cobalamin-dependent protein [Pseudomonadota bacterium]